MKILTIIISNIKTLMLSEFMYININLNSLKGLSAFISTPTWIHLISKRKKKRKCSEILPKQIAIFVLYDTCNLHRIFAILLFQLHRFYILLLWYSYCHKEKPSYNLRNYFFSEILELKKLFSFQGRGYGRKRP